MGHPSTMPDIEERGADRDGAPQRSTRRLFFQLTAFEVTPPLSVDTAVRSLSSALLPLPVGSLVYHDVNHPRGLAVLAWTESPELLVDDLHPALCRESLWSLRVRPELAMLGRTYSTGFEPDLDDWLLRRPRETVRNPAWNWAVWYPLRRRGSFEQLDRKARGEIMREHGAIGRSYGAANLAHDIRLACHGLDANDNEFVIGLVGQDLYPLSHVVQAMRSTRQTSEFMEKMGPFFVGKVAWRKP
jgi:hypothetical protein